MAKKKNTNKLKVIPLGGLHEIGKNMTVLEYDDEIIIIDCGMAFPNNDMLGIDVVIPDFSYLKEHAHKIKGLLITHAHEDHIGAVAYFLREFDVPVFGTPLTLGFIKLKMDEFGLEGNFREIKAGQVIWLGNFKIEAIHITHSVADSLAFHIETPVGSIFHTGDFKFDYTPIDAEVVDFAKLGKIGGDGLLLLMADSTNALRPGNSVSEHTVVESLIDIFRETDSRILIATFSSNVHRVQKIIDIAHMFGRKVAVSGRSIENTLKIAVELGYMHIPADTLVEMKQVKNYLDDEIVIITTGTQGEPMSALARMAHGEHKQIKIKKGDCVILSSSPVPGNEKTVDGLMNALIEKGADVIYNEIADVHASGHACREELKLLHTLLKPKFFMPVHGEIKHLVAHGKLAEELGMDHENIFIAENGSVLEVYENKARLAPEKVQSGLVMVDGLGVGDVGAVVINERRGLAEGGLIAVTVVYDEATGELLGGPELHTRGFTYVKEYGKLLSDVKEVTEAALEKAAEDGITGTQELRNVCKHAIQKYISETMDRHPVVLPIVMKL